jgi:hypothetical protein
MIYSFCGVLVYIACFSYKQHQLVQAAFMAAALLLLTQEADLMSLAYLAVASVV